MAFKSYELEAVSPNSKIADRNPDGYIFYLYGMGHLRYEDPDCARPYVSEIWLSILSCLLMENDKSKLRKRCADALNKGWASE